MERIEKGRLKTFRRFSDGLGWVSVVGGQILESDCFWDSRDFCQIHVSNLRLAIL